MARAMAPGVRSSLHPDWCEPSPLKQDNNRNMTIRYQTGSSETASLNRIQHQMDWNTKNEQMLCRIFELTRQEITGGCELHNFKSSLDINRVIKLRGRMRWLGHYAWMREMRNVHMILVRTPEGKSPFGKPSHKQKYNIKLNLKKKWGKTKWIIPFGKNRDQCHALYKMIMKEISLLLCFKGLGECMHIPVMLLLNKMVASSECNQVCIVCRCRYGHRSCAPHIRVTQLICKALQFIGIKMVVIPEDVVMTRSTCTLKWIAD